MLAELEVASKVNFAAIAFEAKDGRASNGMANENGDDDDNDDDEDVDADEGDDATCVSSLCGANEWCNAASERTLCDSSTRDSAEVGDDKSTFADACKLPSTASSSRLPEPSVLM